MSEGEKFTCALCRGTFTNKWSDAEAEKEAEQLFGFPVPESQTEVLCDDCYSTFLKWIETLTPAERAELDQETHEADADRHA